MAAGAGWSGLGFALVWAWGIGGVAGSWSAGRLLGRIPGRRLLPLPPALLSAAFLLLLLTRAPVAWLAASAVWGAAGWASVAVGQAAGRPRFRGPGQPGWAETHVEPDGFSRQSPVASWYGCSRGA